MSTPLQLNDLPPELLARIFGYLTAPGILGLKLVNRTFRDVVSDQPHLRYRCELAAAGLLDNPDTPGSFFDRRTSLHKYRSRFDGLKPTSKSSLPLSGVNWVCCRYETSGDVYVIHAASTNTLHFCRPPSASVGRPMETWSLPLQFEPEHFVIHPPLDLIVITDNVSARLHLRSMSTGDPHPLAATRWISHDLWPAYMHLVRPGLMISVSDRVLSAWIQDRLALWNWRTGVKFFDSANLYAGSMAFIGDGRLLVAKQVGGPYAQVGEAPVLVLLDTSNLVEFPAVPRQVRFVCDPRYRNMRVRVLAEAGYSDFSGVIGGDVPFYPDPSQRVLALLFYMREDASGASNKAQGICVVRSETLLRLAEEIGEGVVGWEVWGKFTVAPDTDEVPGANEHTKYSVSESRFMRVDSNGARRWAKVRVYDLSHWSRQHPDTELPDGGEGSGEGRVRCRLTEAVLELPENVWNICHAAMLRNSIVFFSFGNWDGMWGPQARGTLDIWSIWRSDLRGPLPLWKDRSCNDALQHDA